LAYHGLKRGRRRRKVEEKKMEFKFTEDCIVGVENIDEEHRYLFHVMNQITDTLYNNQGAEDEKNKLEQYIQQLKEYGTQHFAHEEAYMEEINDSQLLMQKRAHMMFMEKLNSLDIAYLQDDEKRIMLEDMLTYLTRWLYQHIIGSDTLIGKIYHIEVKKKENPCEFTPDYYTNIGFVDEEHRGLFDIIGRAYLLMSEGDEADRYDDIMGIMDELLDYAETHFAHEEEYMEQVQDPNLDKQRRAHRTFLDRLEDRDIGENEENQQEYLAELLDFLFGWLGNHIKKMDKKIGK